jgi:aldose 1-epimerase
LIRRGNPARIYRRKTSPRGRVSVDARPRGHYSGRVTTPLVIVAAARLGLAPAFSAAREADGPSGLEVVVLRYRDARTPARSLEARIVPAIGANLYSLKIGDDELIFAPSSPAELATGPGGTPVLFPTPNRVRDSHFTWAGRTFSFVPNSEANFIHGLVRRRPWHSDDPVATRTGASVRMSIDWDEAQPDFVHFPLPHRLTLTFTLSRGGLRIAYAVENRGREPLPFGFGLHPWFRVPGRREDVYLKVPATYRMEAETLLPTGKLIEVAKTPFDLRRPTPLAGLDLDDVYFGLRAGEAPGFEWRDRGISVRLGASREFTHAVIYTPKRPTFCIENQTSSTDAHNLFARGLKKQAHLLVVAPGNTARGSVDWKIARKLTESATR